MPVNNAPEKGGNEFLNPHQILSEYLQLGFGEKVADLGCGAMGFFTIEAARIVGDKGLVYAVDVLKEVLSSVEGRATIEGLNNIKTVWSDLEKYGAANIPPESLDAIFLINVLFQTTNHMDVVREAIRLLKRGGKLLIIDWKKNKTPFGPEISHRISKDYIKDIALKLRLLFDQEFEAGQFHYGLLFIK